MEKIYTYMLDTMADWEIGTAVAELNSQRFFKKKQDFEVKTFALTREAIRTMGGMTILPDLDLREVVITDAALLILPGAEEWSKPEHEPALLLARQFLQNNIPVAAICGATEAMARKGMLNEVEHTSSGLEYLKVTCPQYSGDRFYKDELAVTDGNLITAGSSSSVAFAYHILKKLDVMEPQILDYWYGYFEKHSTDDIMKLIQEF